MASVDGLAETVREAQAELARAVQRGHLTDDPIRHVLEALALTLGALQEITETAGSEMEARVARICDQVTAAGVQQAETVKTTAASVISRAGEWSAERLKAAADEAARTVLQRITEEAERAERAARVARRATAVAILGCVAVLAGTVGWFAVFLH